MNFICLTAHETSRLLAAMRIYYKVYKFERFDGRKVFTISTPHKAGHVLEAIEVEGSGGERFTVTCEPELRTFVRRYAPKLTCS